MRISRAFPRKPGRYLRAAELTEEKLCTIKQVTIEEMGRDGETKPVIWFN